MSQMFFKRPSFFKGNSSYRKKNLMFVPAPLPAPLPQHPQSKNQVLPVENVVNDLESQNSRQNLKISILLLGSTICLLSLVTTCLPASTFNILVSTCKYQ